MLNDKTKLDIYEKLTSAYKFGEKYAVSEIGKYLTTCGFNSKRFGYGQMRSLLRDIPEFLTISKEEINGEGKNSDVVIIKEWAKAKAVNASDSKAKKREQSSVDKIEDENETVSLSVFQKSNFESFTSTNRNYNNFSRNYGNFRQEAGKQEIRATAGGVRFSESSGNSIFKAEKAKPVASSGRNERKQEGAKQEEDSSFERLAYLTPKVLDYIARKDTQDPAAVLNEAYLKSLKNKTYLQRGATITFPFVAGDGQEMLAVLRRNEKAYGKPWYLSYVGLPQKEEAEPEETDDKEDEKINVPGKMLENFADIGYWQEFLKELAELALPENWDFRATRERGRYYILKKYIQYTFYRLQQQNKIAVAPGNFAAFNTGLVNNRYQDIYACFLPNPHAGENDLVPEWKFEAFAIAGQRGKDGYGKMLTSYFNPLPQVATYYDSLQDLFYDINAPLVTDYEHIIIDNIDRLPLDYLKECMYSDEEAQDLLNHLENADSREKKKQAYYALSNYVVDNDRIFRRLKDRMEDAIDTAVKRVRWNFRAAVPCYFPKGNCMSLMLPLALSDDTRTDMALVVLRNPSGSYQGNTILELEKAYLDARLICRPNDDWMSSEVVGNASYTARNNSNDAQGTGNRQVRSQRGGSSNTQESDTKEKQEPSAFREAFRAMKLQNADERR